MGTIMTYKERYIAAKESDKGDNWRHRKTGKTVIVLNRVGNYGLHLLHESGRKTVRLERTLASEYEPFSA